jgi:hypothetical protein
MLTFICIMNYFNLHNNHVRYRIIIIIIIPYFTNEALEVK